MEDLPCGCRMGTGIVDGVNTFVFEPCAADCTYYAYVTEQLNARPDVSKELRYVK